MPKNLKFEDDVIKHQNNYINLVDPNYLKSNGQYFTPIKISKWMYRWVNFVKPKIFMVENVKGLLTHDNGNTLKKILETMNKNNLYNISYKCLDSSKYNVPQKRERVFIVGVLKTINKKFYFPEECENKKVLRDVLYNVPNSHGLSYSEEKKNLFKMIPQGGCWINLPKELQKEYLGNSYNTGGGKRGSL